MVFQADQEPMLVVVEVGEEHQAQAEPAGQVMVLKMVLAVEMVNQVQGTAELEEMQIVQQLGMAVLIHPRPTE
jgi:hypothetical protein